MRPRPPKARLASVRDDSDARLHRRRELALDQVHAGGWEPGLTPETYDNIIALGLKQKTLPLAFVATEILVDEHPMTQRGLGYRLLSSGWLTSMAEYDKLSRITGRLREAGIVPFEWLVDHVRSTLKPSSWSGLADFTEVVREAYRKDFWASLPHYVHVVCEKDAMAGVLEPVTAEYDVRLSVIRGYAGRSFAHDIAKLWERIEKPIFAYYLGDFDPSGLDLERDLHAKLVRYCNREFTWQRLAVVPGDFAEFNLRALMPKATDTRTRGFRAKGHTDCAELDAIPATALRERLTQAIVQHIPHGMWERLQEIENLERAQFEDFMAKFTGTDS